MPILNKPEDAAAAFQSAWNTHDMTALGDLFTTDATFVNRFGHYVRGVDEIIALHAPIHETVYRDSTLENEVIDVAHIGENAAVVHFWSRLSANAAHPAGPHQVDTVILAVLTRQETGWLICALENVTLTNPRTGEAILATANSNKFMSDTNTLISALETAPGVIIPMIREVPPQILKRRPSPAKWSAYEHAVHLSQSDALFRERLDLILSTTAPYIRSAMPTPEEEAGSLLEIDLDERLDAYVRERAALIDRVKKLSADEWQKTAEHEAFDHYSIFIMFRHLLNHEMLHAYRIEELLLKKDWD